MNNFPRLVSENVPPRYLLPAVIQEILDLTYGEYFSRYGITPEELREPDTLVTDHIGLKIHRQYGKFPLIGEVSNVPQAGPNWQRTAKLLGGALMTATSIQTIWLQAEQRMDPVISWDDAHRYPFKRVELLRSLAPDSEEALLVQTMPGSLPAMFHRHEATYVESAAYSNVQPAEAIAAILHEFGPEAVHYLDDEESADVIALLRHPANQWVVEEADE